MATKNRPDRTRVIRPGKLSKSHQIAPEGTDYGRLYQLGSVAVLCMTTVIWSLFGAASQRINADQLVNPYMFGNSEIFKNALFPGQHTYFLKWPLFWLINLLKESNGSYAFMTVVVSLITVLSFAYVLSKIERRPIYFGTLILLLSSALLIVPAQPYAGGLLPVNMAMIATRNIEYVIYIAALYLFVRTQKMKSWMFVWAILLLAILIASDKLFLSISAAGSLIMLVGYGLKQRWPLVTLAIRWLIGTGAAAVGALAILAILKGTGSTHIVGQGTNPYGFLGSAMSFMHALFYGFLSVLTNFGANPAFDVIKTKSMPDSALRHIFSAGGPAILINLTVLSGGLYTVWRLIMSSTDNNKKHRRHTTIDQHYLAAVMLLTSGMAAIAAFIVTNHYYPADARYVSIVLFGVFMSIAVFTRTRVWPEKQLMQIGAVVTVCMVFAIPMMTRTSQAERTATKEVDQRNASVAQAIANHPVNTLVGDYWRVIPIKHLSDNTIAVTPLEDCTNARSILSSLSWQPDLQKNSFAYLLSFDKSLTNFPRCSLDGVFNAFGRPNLSVVISGTLENPKELLLFYDHGIHKNSPSPSAAPAVNAVTTPLDASELTNTSCTVPTIMNIVAHQDDDLLFMNPDTARDIAAGHCVRTVYVTAGDAGGSKFYWLGREQGSEAAYNSMIGTDALWIDRTIKLAHDEYVTIATPRGNSKVSLIFMHLPDGNLGGQGFRSFNFESLYKLSHQEIPAVQSVYGDSSFSADSLTNALATLMHLYQPAEIRTQSVTNDGHFHDHSDHMAVGHFVNEAYKRYKADQYNDSIIIPIRHYLGYTARASAPNISGEDLAAKTATFLSYAKHDGSVCQSDEGCRHDPAYGLSLPRQYEAGE